VDPGKGLKAVLCGNISFKFIPQGNAVLAFDIGQAFGVDDAGVEILSYLSEARYLGEIVDRFTGDYEATRERIAQDVSDFLQDCADFGIVAFVEEPDPRE